MNLFKRRGEERRKAWLGGIFNGRRMGGENKAVREKKGGKSYVGGKKRKERLEGRGGEVDLKTLR